MLLIKIGISEKQTRDYVCNGATTLFTALLEIVTGKTTGIRLATAPAPGVSCISQTCGARISRSGTAFGDGQLSHTSEGRGSSLVSCEPVNSRPFHPDIGVDEHGRGVGIIERRAIHRGTFRSCPRTHEQVPGLVESAGRNRLWTKTAEQILSKVDRKALQTRDTGILGQACQSVLREPSPPLIHRHPRDTQLRGKVTITTPGSVRIQARNTLRTPASCRNNLSSGFQA